MIPLLALALPDTGWIIVVCIVLAIIGIVGVGIILSFLRDLRANLASELRSEIERGDKPMPMSIAQPFKVEPAEKFASHIEFTELKDDVERIRQDVQRGFKELGEERRTSVGNLHGKIDHTNAKVDEMRGEVRLLNQQLQQILTRQLK